jgi:catechol 2,3-dioxygenase-like lactoylglutathione lyase family enzyme
MNIQTRAAIGIDHVQVALPPGSEDRCRAFYVGVLGFEEIEKPQVLKARGGLWLAVGHDQLHLGVEDDFRPARKAHPAFRLGDLDALAGRLMLAGAEAVWADPGEIPGRRRFFTFDPLGNRLEFVEAA